MGVNSARAAHRSRAPQIDIIRMSSIAARVKFQGPRQLGNSRGWLASSGRVLAVRSDAGRGGVAEPNRSTRRRSALERLHGLELLSDGRELPLGLLLRLRNAHASRASTQTGDWYVYRSRNTASCRVSYLVFSSGIKRLAQIIARRFQNLKTSPQLQAGEHFVHSVDYRLRLILILR